MELVVDANILVAGFMKAAVTRELLLDERLTLAAPEHGLAEARKVFGGTAFRKRLGGLAATDINGILDLLLGRIQIVPAAEYNRSLSQARKLAAHFQDAPYLALALHLGVGIWSNDAGFRKQTLIRVITTRELLWFLNVR